MNTMTFQDLVNGNYGRKIAYVNYDTVTKDNVLDILQQGISVFNYNKPAIEYLWNYYKGDQPSLYRTKIVREDVCNKIVSNHAYEIVQFKTGQTYGEPLQYTSNGTDEEISKSVDKFIRYMTAANNHARDIEKGYYQSAVGTSYKCMQKVNGAIPFRIVVLDPLNTFVIYSSFTKEPLMSVQILKDSNNESYYLIFTDTHECKVTTSNEIVEGSWKLHGYGGNPIVECPNNPERISDIEIVITLLDAINDYECNRIDSVEQFVQSFMKFINCEIDEDTFKEMKAMGAFMIKSNNGENKADVDIMSQELKQSETQIAKDDLIESVYTILAIPNKQGSNGTGDTQGAVELRNGWDFSKSAAKLKDPFTLESEKRLCVPILKRIELTNNDCPLSILDFDIKIHHSPLDNMIIKAQFLDYLLKDGVHPKIAFERSTLFPDSEKAYQESKPYLDAKYQTYDEILAQQKAEQQNQI